MHPSAKLTEGPSPPPCTQIVTGDVRGPFTVAAGQTLCVIDARVVGPITVGAGGALIVRGSRVTNGIVATGPAHFSLCGSQVSVPSRRGRALVVSDAAVPVRIGDPSEGCAPNQVGGHVMLTANTAGLTLGTNTISGSVTVDDNAGITVIKANTVSGTLACSANRPRPVNAGQPNTAVAKTGQCAAL